MARQTINTGTSANDGTGDTLRTAGTKINENFTELYTLVGGGGAGVSALTDSGVDFIGASFRTKIGHVNPTAERNIDFPNASGEVTLNTASQTLTNKTLTQPSIDSATFDRFKIKDLDSSHHYNFVPSNLAANRNVVLPLLGSNDVMVMEAHNQTLTNKSLASPTISSPKITTHLSDSTGNPVISFTDVGNTRNRIKVTGVSNGNTPSLSVIGSTDANIGLDISSKGTGIVNINQYGLSSETLSNGDTASLTKSLLLLQGGAGTVTLPNGPASKTLNLHVIRQSGAGDLVLSITAAQFPQGSTGVTFQQFDTATLIWDGTNWYVMGGEGHTVS
tara:strand:- start:22809 stop:23807 length:999 start_codon:yes stop_codon:yes gene_type:complete